MMHEVIGIKYKGEEYTFRIKVNEKKTVRNWLTIKLIPAGEKFKESYQLIDNDHATIVWNQLANHFYSSNNVLMLNDDLMETFKQKIKEDITLVMK